MSKECAICGKSSMLVWKLRKLRGKFNPTTQRRKYPNLQWVTLAAGKRIKACTKCIKTLAKRNK
ncbi:MAG: L28 family ribosomal protein [Candidatus Pacebacteria bacterium]|nr:L28 family ribosomal protein [Candidatus Paceibacterota bacterium]